MLAGDTNEVEIPITIRDFKAATKGGNHHDFERTDGKDPQKPVKGLVESTIGSDRKPVYNGGERQLRVENHLTFGTMMMMLSANGSK